MADTRRLGVVASGRGSNLQSIINAMQAGQIKAEIGVVITDKPEAKALDRAREAGICAVCINRKTYASRESFEQALVAELKKHQIDLVILAGFMRILSPFFVQAFKDKIMNIHPSLLPAFPGAHAHRDVLAYRAKVSGCTIHFVDEGMDSGPIILQQSVPVLDDDTEDSLAARVLEIEHVLYPKAIALYLDGKLEVQGRHVIIKK
ncbi:phosphoribosylglycinamide formyltransferase [Anaerosinus massiliensis]|uniref:phosphoribosylglycinamide formyltransferase n=1 Tax=Massilibacillus massiliensis TaxID=1806837 RepID=UPI000A54BE10|nr:phosphoribosylglycinamide formyltransferase [Massilibacillus massiliensis]